MPPATATDGALRRIPEATDRRRDGDVSDGEDARRGIPLPVLRRHSVSVVCEEKMAPEKSEID